MCGMVETFIIYPCKTLSFVMKDFELMHPLLRHEENLGKILDIVDR